jgi:hypothetical protein
MPGRGRPEPQPWSQSLNICSIAGLADKVFRESRLFPISHDARGLAARDDRAQLRVEAEPRATMPARLAQGMRGEVSMPGVRPGSTFSAEGIADSCE